MRVLQINSVCGIGSTGRIATDIQTILTEQGNESYIAFGRDRALNCEKSIRIGSKIDNYRHVALTRICDKHGFGSKKATQDFIAKVNKLKPDIIHLHNIHGYYINVELLFEYLKKTNKPVVWTLHDCWAFTGHCSNFEFNGCECWKIDGNHHCIQKKSYPSSLLINNSKENYERKRKAFTGVKNLTIVTPSIWLENLVKQSFLSEYPIQVINNGIDLEIFRHTESTFRARYKLEDKFIILGVANVWSQMKGFNYFLELSTHLLDDEVIVLVGLNSKQLKKLPPNIIGITRTNSTKELAEIYSAVDVFVNPTLEDVMGLVNVEALACGTPVITFNTGGTIETVDRTCGIVVKKGDLMELKSKIRLIKKNNSKHYFDKCIERATVYYDKNKRFQEYLNLYSKVVMP